MKIKKLNCNFFSHLYLAYNCSEQQYVDYLNKDSKYNWFVDNNIGSTAHYVNKQRVFKIVIWIDQKREKSNILRTIYHEVGHGLIKIFERVDSKIEDSTSELFLYAQEEIVNQILEIFKKSKK